MALLSANSASNVYGGGSGQGSNDLDIRSILNNSPAPRSNVLGAQTMYGGINYSAYQPAAYTPAQTKQVNYPSGGGGQAATGGQPFQDPFSQINIPSPQDPLGGGSSQLSVINDQFNAFNDLLNQQESQVNQNFQETKGLYDTQKANAEQQYQGEKATQTSDIKRTESLNLKQVRQLLGELSQGNAARTAISGGGSISEVLAERFGREAQSRLGNVQEATRSSLQRVNDFYNNSITKLNDSYQANILQAKQTLDDNLNQIRTARTQSAQAKQQGTLDAWQNYYNTVNQSKIEAAQFKAQYDLWKDQQDQAMAATGDFNLGNSAQLNQQTASSLSPISQASGQVYDPVSRTFFTKKAGESEDELAQRLGLNYSPALQQYSAAPQ